MYKSNLIKMYQNPAKYGLDPQEKDQAYLESSIFKLNKNNTSPSPGYMSWDGLHPSMQTAYELFKVFSKQLKQTYEIKPKQMSFAQKLWGEFKDVYLDELRQQQDQFGVGLFKHTDLEPKYYSSSSTVTPVFAIKKIVEHAQAHSDGLTSKVIKKLGWCDNDDNLNKQIKSIMQAHDDINLGATQKHYFARNNKLFHHQSAKQEEDETFTSNDSNVLKMSP